MTDLASRYGPQLRQLKAIFPSWDEGDLAFTLQDVKGNVDEAAMMITEGEHPYSNHAIKANHSLPLLSRFSNHASIRASPIRPSNPIHRSNHKEEGFKSTNQGHNFKALEP
jgi:hypothetical protein